MFAPSRPHTPLLLEHPHDGCKIICNIQKQHHAWFHNEAVSKTFLKIVLLSHVWSSIESSCEKNWTISIKKQHTFLHHTAKSMCTLTITPICACWTSPSGFIPLYSSNQLHSLFCEAFPVLPLQPYHTISSWRSVLCAHGHCHAGTGIEFLSSSEGKLHYKKDYIF